LPEVNLGTQGLLNGSNQSSGIGIKINLNFFYKGEKVTAEQDWNPRIPKGTGPGIAGEDRREEPPKNQRGRGDLTDVNMRLAKRLDGNTD